ncbi:hypothetical protein PV458_09535 [Streptomyces sp. MN03-5084-2B]|nr:hypothetical protein [Streptomyces sp. MN03-5084-2B]
MPGKYEPLRQHLAAFASADRTAAELSFSEIAELVDGLPASAYESRPWWANSSHTQAQAWRAAGWHVQHVNFDRQRVRFARGAVNGTYVARVRLAGSVAHEALPAEETGAAELDVRVRMAWQKPAHVVLDEVGGLAFPDLPRAPGIYRLTLSQPAGHGGRLRVYVGESDNLRKRSSQYRRPGPTQQTSRRIHHKLRNHLHGGGTVTIAVATAATITARGESHELSLARKTARVLAEHAALALIYLDGDAEVINMERTTPTYGPLGGS